MSFETDNRAFFEATINARPACYYAPGGVEDALALEDARADRGYQYLLKNGQGAILGRVNLGQVRRAHFQSAVLGYRIAEAECGKGYAGEAVRQVLGIAFGELDLARVEADCRVENAASARVLLRNGFTQFGHSRRSFELHGAWHDRLHFECHALARQAPGPNMHAGILFVAVM
jgi:[ribosomal protein S5]-alanine N-acetyltransferase